MLRFILDPIACDNAAFCDDPAAELARMLRDVATRLERGETIGHVRDENGNRVSRFELDDGE